jgi:hypothetical protein
MEPIRRGVEATAKTLQEEAVTDVDELIQWMTHRGQGRWESFKEVTVGLLASNVQPLKSYGLADALSMIGLADFFVNGTDRWRVIAPTVAGTQEGEAVVVGGRTAKLRDRLKEAAGQEGVDVFEELLHGDVARVRLYALTDGDLRRVAERVGIPFVPQAAERMIRQAPTIDERVRQGHRSQPPRNWMVKSYDFSKPAWTIADMAHTAKVFTPSRGVPRYMVERLDGSFVEMERRGTVYAAAYSRSIALLHYDPDRSTVSVPTSAPLPADLARAAALCTGNLPSRENGRIVFAGVRWSVASVLLALTGCPLPLAQAGATGAGR